MPFTSPVLSPRTIPAPQHPRTPASTHAESIDAGPQPLRYIHVTPTVTQRGPDANFLETIVIKTRLPEDQLFMPNLNVRVFDYALQARRVPRATRSTDTSTSCNRRVTVV